MNEELIRLKFSDKTTQWFPLSTMSGEVRTEGLTVIVDDIALNNTMSGVANYELADGTALTFPLAISGQKVTFPMTTQLVRDGEVKLQLEIYDGNNVYKSAVYKYIVNKSLGYVTITNEEQQIIQSIVIEENKRVVNENTRIANENARIANENTRISNEDKRQASITDIENRFASLSTAQQQQAEVADARMDTHGTVHANLKTRLDEDFKELASKIPTGVAMNGYESVTTNDTLSGEVSSAVLSGNTMVNIVAGGGVSNVVSIDTSKKNASYQYALKPKPLTRYTILYKISNLTGSGDGVLVVSLEQGITGTWAQQIKSNGIYMLAVTTRSELFPMNSILVYWEGAVETVTKSCDFSNLTIIEGDHTDKPLEFFDGLKSAEVAEINTHGVNLFDAVGGEKVTRKGYSNAITDVFNGGFTITGGHASLSSIVSKPVKPNTQYVLTFTQNDDVGVALTNKRAVSVPKGFDVGIDVNTLPIIASTANGRRMTFLTEEDTHCVAFGYYGNSGSLKSTFSDISLYEVTPNTPTEYVPYTSSKTTLSEPIILRSLPNGISDTYDVDTGVLTRRCGEVVLNGSESWANYSTGVTEDMACFFTTSLVNLINYSSGTPEQYSSDKFNSGYWGDIYQAKPNIEQFANGGDKLYFKIAKSKLATPDVAGFKAWLSANPTTVVYQLAEPTTEYIENNGQLRSYDSQTTVFANSIVPVKIGGNIPVNYASTLSNLATQARNLQIENTALIEQAESLSEQLNIAEKTNNFQDELIDVSLMATDELYVMLEPLLAQPMSATNTQNVSDETTTITQNVSDETTKNTQGGNAMVDAYVAMVIRGLKTIDEVPARYREEVRRILSELDK